jgi:hypothetical protein
MSPRHPSARQRVPDDRCDDEHARQQQHRADYPPGRPSRATRYELVELREA